MRTTIHSLLIVFLFAFMAVASASAQDMKKAPMKEESGQVKTAACDPKCGFKVSSRNEKEIIAVMKAHAKKYHHMNMTDKEVKDMIKTE